MRALALMLALAASAAAQSPAVVYVPIPEHLGGDCGATETPACRVDRPWAPDSLRARLDGDAAVWRSAADEVTFAWAGEASGVDACCSLQMPLSPVEGTNLWVLSARVPDADRLVMSVRLVVRRLDGSGVERVDLGRWAGPLAPPETPSAEVLTGTLRTDSLQSTALGTMRAVTVYLPPASESTAALPVVYLADGQSTEAYARVLEPAILNGRVPRVALVGLHNAAHERSPDHPVDGRAREYLVGLDSARYAAHERFFVDEVMPWAERTYGVSAAPSDRTVAGASNGASFASAMVRRHRDRFRTGIAFSHAYDGVDAEVGGDLTGVRFAFLAGHLEGSFAERSEALAAAMAARGARVWHEVRESGHDEAMWLDAFPEVLQWALSGSDEP